LYVAVALAIVGGIAVVFTVFDLLARRHTRELSVVIALDRLEAKTERELRQRQHMFARMVGHEIRTPASSICGALDLMRSYCGVKEGVLGAYVDIVAGGAEQILTLARSTPSAASQTLLSLRESPCDSFTPFALSVAPLPPT
jgi:signal transduction histidine kinase